MMNDEQYKIEALLLDLDRMRSAVLSSFDHNPTKELAGLYCGIMRSIEATEQAYYAAATVPEQVAEAAPDFEAMEEYEDGEALAVFLFGEVK